MQIGQVFADFVSSRHLPVREFLHGADQTFLFCFDEEGNDVSIDDVAQVSQGGKQGELEYFEPVAGVGHYAHLRLAGSGANLNGASTRYVFQGPDWVTTIHVTEPSQGGAPDAVADPFEVTAGAESFAAKLAARFT